MVCWSSCKAVLPSWWAIWPPCRWQNFRGDTWDWFQPSHPPPYCFVLLAATYLQTLLLAGTILPSEGCWKYTLGQHYMALTAFNTDDTGISESKLSQKGWRSSCTHTQTFFCRLIFKVADRCHTLILAVATFNVTLRDVPGDLPRKSFDDMRNSTRFVFLWFLTYLPHLRAFAHTNKNSEHMIVFFKLDLGLLISIFAILFVFFILAAPPTINFFLADNYSVGMIIFIFVHQLSMSQLIRPLTLLWYAACNLPIKSSSTLSQKEGCIYSVPNTFLGTGIFIEGTSNITTNDYGYWRKWFIFRLLPVWYLQPGFIIGLFQFNAHVLKLQHACASGLSNALR